MRSSSRLGMASRAPRIWVRSVSWAACRPASATCGSNLASNSCTNHCTSCGLARQRVLDVLLTEGEADLAEVLGVGPEHRHITDVEAGDDNEAVEAIALDGATNEADERVDHVGRATCVQHATRWGADADVVEVDTLAADAERVGLLVEGDEAEMVEQREQLGQRHRRAAPVHAHPPLAGLRIEVVAESDGKIVVPRQHLLDPAQIGRRPLGSDRRPDRRPGPPFRRRRTDDGRAPHRARSRGRCAAGRSRRSTARRSPARGHRGRHDGRARGDER